MWVYVQNVKNWEAKYNEWSTSVTLLKAHLSILQSMNLKQFEAQELRRAQRPLVLAINYYKNNNESVSIREKSAFTGTLQCIWLQVINMRLSFESF